MNRNSRTVWAGMVFTFLVTGMLGLSLTPRAFAGDRGDFRSAGQAMGAAAKGVGHEMKPGELIAAGKGWGEDLGAGGDDVAVDAGKGGKDAGKGIGKGGKDAGKGVDKGAKDAGKGVGKGGKDAGKGIGKGGKDVGRGIKKAVTP